MSAFCPSENNMEQYRAGEAAEMLNAARVLYSQRKLAQLLDVVPRTIARWEKGEVPIPSLVVPALRDVVSGTHASPAAGDFTFIDLFAGIGGIRLGFEAVGGKCVFTSEWDAYCQKTYAANFPNDEHAIHGDITAIDAADIPDHDLLVAGFPCQPFSIAGVSKKNALGRPHGFECTTQGTLFFDVARIIATKRPKAFLLENVKNLVSHDGGNTMRVILETLREQLGYHVTWKVIDGSHFVPQHRERCLIVGFREDVGFEDNLLQVHGSKEDGPRLRAILHAEDGTEDDHDEGRYLAADGKVHKKYTLSDKLWTYLQDYAKKHREKGNGFGFGLVGPDDVSRTLSARYYKDGSEILVERGKRKNPRRLTPRECARLMGFDDTFKIVVSDTRAYKQFGNSVVVPLIRHVATKMKPFLMSLKDEEAAKQPSLFAKTYL